MNHGEQLILDPGREDPTRWFTGEAVQHALVIPKNVKKNMAVDATFRLFLRLDFAQRLTSPLQPRVAAEA